MSYTAAQLDTFIGQLDEAISEGVLRVNLDGMVVTYNTLTEMRRARDDYKSQKTRLLGLKPIVSHIDMSSAW